MRASGERRPSGNHAVEGYVMERVKAPSEEHGIRTPRSVLTHERLMNSPTQRGFRMFNALKNKASTN